MRKFLYIIIVFGLIFMTGCDSSSSNTALSSVAKLSAFSFAKNDSMPGLAEAVFTIEERLDTGLVWNKDSIRYGTRLDSVVPKFTFEATPSAAYLTFPDTDAVYRLTGYDTLDFTKQPIYLTVRSADNSTTKVYEIHPTVHQVDPDLYTWEKLTDAVYPSDDSEQRVLLLGSQFVMMTSNGFALHAYASADGISWSDKGTPAGLPAGTKVRQIVCDGATLYYGQESTVYTSTDAVNWTAHNVGQTVKTMVLYWNEEVWALVEKGVDDYELATYADGALTMSGLTAGPDFPVSDFGVVTFLSPSLRERAMIIGGFAENGRSLNSRWNIEYVRPMPSSEGVYRMEEFSIARPDFTSLTGISVIDYNDQLLLFGGVDEKMSYLGRDILISDDEGLNWYQADTVKNRLPEAYQARQKQSAVVRDNYIYLFGGQDKKVTYSDVYRGRLNSIDW